MRHVLGVHCQEGPDFRCVCSDVFRRERDFLYHFVGSHVEIYYFCLRCLRVYATMLEACVHIDLCRE